MKNERFIAVLLTAGLFLTGMLPADAQTFVGAGASFPYPVYSQWAYKYNKLTGIMINYQSIGSGGGIAQIFAPFWYYSTST